MAVKIQPKMGSSKDDTAMNAIRLKCSDGTELKEEKEREGTGHWKRYETSAGKIVGVSLRSEEHLKDNGDDTAANGLKFRDERHKEYSPGYGFWGDWSHWVDCPEGSVITGFRVMFLDFNFKYDNTALNQVQFSCS